MKNTSYLKGWFRVAKIKGPLFSIEGLGKINKSIIYSKNKGIKTAKSYMVPCNPDSDDQKVQRGFMANSILAWKTDGYTMSDIEAWNVYAKTQKGSLSGYNMFLKERINFSKLGYTWHSLKNCVIEDITHMSCTVYIDYYVNNEHRLHLGKSKNVMIEEIQGIFLGDKYKFSLTDLEEDTRYYFYVGPWGEAVQERTGIYNFKTITYSPPTLDVGNEAIDRIDSVGGELTIVDKYNPANENGTITEVEVYLANETSIKIAIFFQVSGNFLSTRSWVDLSYQPAGYSKHAVNLPIQAGDFIGIYTGAGEIKTDETGVGRWIQVGDLIPCTNAEFFWGDNYTISLKGTGIL